jgi:SSS family solute:Na+ symporter
MQALFWFVILYWVFSVGIGVYTTKFVKNSKDFAVAGRKLPMSIVTAMVFATWFGSEAVLGVSSTFLENGLGGIIADPFGASLCLIFVGLFFARRLYRMNLLTIGDYYRQRYGRVVEIIMTICIVISYLGWVAAQIKALGVVFNVISGGYVSMEMGMIIGSVSVVLYTLLGGMWAVAVTDFLQMIVVVVGLLYIGWEVSDMVGGVGVVISHASDAGKFQFWPAPDSREILWFFAAWITMMLGSIPQQDVFQRVMSSKNENIAARASVLGGCLYFAFVFIPVFLAYSATLIDPKMVEELMGKDPQLILPTMIMEKMPLFAQIMFFGALLSAIKSCASATLLAPSVTITENIIKDIHPWKTDREFLFKMRAVVLVFAVIVTTLALNSESSIYEMVENAYCITLVSAFVPLALGLYWKRSSRQGALLSIVLGLSSWQLLEHFAPDGYWPPQLVGVLLSLTGMIIGSLLPQWISPVSKEEAAVAKLSENPQ